MPLLTLPDFAAGLPKLGGLLGLDPGSKTIGVAGTDPTRLIASSIEGIWRTKFAWDAERIFELWDEREAVGLVIGLPLNMDGSAGPAAQSARAFANNLLKIRDVPLLMWDERLSTVAVTRTLIDADMSRQKRANVVDKTAAAWVLQGLIDRLREDARRAEQVPE